MEYGSTMTECLDSDSDTHSSDSESDRTYILEDNEPSASDTDSYMTAETLRGSSHPSSISRSESLLAELRELRSATPLKEMAGQIDRWISTGVYTRQPQQPVPSNAIGSGPSSAVVCFCFRRLDTVILNITVFSDS